MPTEQHQPATWTPGWYELDQTLVVGERRRYWFFDQPPENIVGETSANRLVFFNQLDSATNSTVRWAVISDMYHPILGELSRVDTDGLDYIFVPASGPEVVVNAEEEPGKCYDETIQVSDWSVTVTFSEVSDPIAVT